MMHRITEILQGRFMKHPLHPMFVHLPVGLWFAALISDIIFMVNGAPPFAASSYYCILLGLIGAALAIPTGLAEYVSIPRKTSPKRIAATHMALNVAITVLFLFSLISRHRLEDGIPTVITRGQFFVTIFANLLLAISGYLGGLLVYDHGIGFKPQLRGRPSEAVPPAAPTTPTGARRPTRAA